MGDIKKTMENVCENETLMENVEWSIDAASSNEEETERVTPLVRVIPRFDEPDFAEHEFQRKFKEEVTKTQSNSKVDELMKKSVIVPGFEQLHSVPTSSASKRQIRKERKKEREKTKGPGWFNIPVQEVTEEVKNDLDLLKMRSILDPKHVYKKNDLTHTPKYFQVGKVLETPADYYNGRIPKAQRKRTLVDELLADADARAYQKKKYKSIVDTSRRRKSKPRSASGDKKLKNKKKK